MLYHNDEQERSSFGSVLDSHTGITQTILTIEIRVTIPAAQNPQVDGVSLSIPLFVSMVPVDRMSPQEAEVASGSELAIGGGVAKTRV